jgi:hypothetical protein
VAGDAAPTLAVVEGVVAALPHGFKPMPVPKL